MPRIFPLGLLLLALTACGNHTGPEPNIYAGIWQRVKTAGQAAPPSALPPAPLTRADFADVSVPVILLTLPRTNTTASLGLVRQNAATRTYLSVDGISVMTQDGILSGTRGFGDDLMTSDHPGLLANLTRGSGSHIRSYRHLNHLDELVPWVVRCTITPKGAQDIDILGVIHNTNLRVEICTGNGATITNRYWIKGSTIWKSSQWISATIGPITLEQIQ